MSISIYCPHCQKYTALSVAPAAYADQRGNTNYTLAIWEDTRGQQWWIGVCNSCNMPVLVLDNGRIIYPNPLPSPTDSNIPKDLAKDLDEAKMCFSVGCYRACAVMARRCIQNACLEKGAKEKDLVKQINELCKLGIITNDIEEWATVVRWIGNDAAHPNKEQVKKEDAEDCLNLAEQFLHVIFVTSAVAKARRAARNK
jgi:HEPN domain-containing protein